MSSEPTILVDGRPISLASVDPHQPLLHFLRERGLTGTKEGCAEGECGACAVVVVTPEGESSRFVTVNSCLVPAVGLAGREVITVQGLAEGEALHPVQAAMVETGGSQCGYCTPGFVLMTRQLLDENPDPDDDEIKHYLSGNLCRCGAYPEIVQAVRLAGEKRRAR